MASHTERHYGHRCGAVIRVGSISLVFDRQSSARQASSKIRNIRQDAEDTDEYQHYADNEGV